MRLYLTKSTDTPLAEPNARHMGMIGEALRSHSNVVQVQQPEEADFLVLHETASFKNRRYVDQLAHDPLIGRYPERAVCISTDDSATGLLPGIYTSLPARRFSPNLHRAIPFPDLANAYVETAEPPSSTRRLLASWRGNPKSNRVRSALMRLYGGDPRFCIESTESWFNHGEDEHRRYVELIKDSCFSLCPGGWAPNTFRIYDSMALGVCPVIIANGWVPPVGPKWEEFCIFISPESVSNLGEVLVRYQGEAVVRGRLARESWERFFAGGKRLEYIADSLVSLIRTLPAMTASEAMARWRSYNVFWANGWTLPQRLARRLARRAR